jgi:hypothetical protein
MSVPDAGATQPAVTDRKFIRTDDFRTIYTNFVQAAFTPYDVSLVLGESEINDSGQLIVEQSARVVMSPAEAQAVVGILANAIMAYEQTWGKIVSPKMQEQKTEGE